VERLHLRSCSRNHSLLLWCFVSTISIKRIVTRKTSTNGGRGADLREFDCPGLRKAVDEEIRTARIDFIILDYPFGRDHPRFENLIDLSVFVDTLLDVAMARRIMRDYGAVAGKATSEVLE